MVALAPGDEMGALRLADLDEVLARHLERRLDRFRAAADEVGVAHASGRAADQLVGQRLGDVGGEEAGVRVGDAVDLRVHRGAHVGMAVAERRDRGAAGGVEVLAPFAVDDRHALGRDGGRRGLAQAAMQDVAHDASARLFQGHCLLVHSFRQAQSLEHVEEC